jgi:hypothetical protein
MQDFYEDLFEELSKYGEIESLNICDNLADHMVPLFISYCIDHCRTVSNLLIRCFVSKKALISDPLDLQVGNVYVQFREEEHAAEAFKNLTGRFYAGSSRKLVC